MKKYLIMALAAFGLAACTEKDDNTTAPIINGELEESYIAINLLSADRDTRILGDENSYNEGTALERQIKSAYIFFFDENGNPFNVMGHETENGATAPGASKNHLPLAISDVTQSGMPNISDIKDAVLVLNTYKGVHPKQMVAVLNWTPANNTSYTLENLRDILATVGNDDNGYVMSNSVYLDSSSKLVDAVPIPESAIKTNSADALGAPINIYVERIAAKVMLTADSGVDGYSNIFSTNTTSSLLTTLDQITATKVYVKLNGWELYNDYSTSNLIKNIKTDWATSDQVGFNWNDYYFYRCYWAESQNEPINNQEFAWQYTEANVTANDFQTEYGFAVAQNTTNVPRSAYTYCGENTNGTNENLRTKVILKGQLMQEDGNGGYKPLELASWYGNEYAGVENLKKAVANSLAYTLFYEESGEYISIKPGDIECVAVANSNQVGFKLTTAGEAKNWYTYNSVDLYQPIADITNRDEMVAETNAYLAGNVKPALIYASGQTYYIIDIKHLGAEGKDAEFGVVRNHVYHIDIKSITGYGSPIYNGFSNILTPPEYPEVYDSSYVAAKINVLSWKIVYQGVDIKQ